MNTKLLATAALCFSFAACAPVGTDGANGSSSSRAAERYVSGDCQVGGCSAEVCGEAGDEPIASNCIYNPTFACYRAARCEKQANGLCGWTMTSDLSACLMDPPTQERT